jgi:hypothetical protein
MLIVDLSLFNNIQHFPVIWDPFTINAFIPGLIHDIATKEKIGVIQIAANRKTVTMVTISPPEITWCSRLYAH